MRRGWTSYFLSSASGLRGDQVELGLFHRIHHQRGDEQLERYLEAPGLVPEPFEQCWSQCHLDLGCGYHGRCSSLQLDTPPQPPGRRTIATFDPPTQDLRDTLRPPTIDCMS